MITLTIDVEQYGGHLGSTRFLKALEPLLQQLADADALATFFVVGELAPFCADMLREVASCGHEVGLHGHTHRFLDRLTPREFDEELRSGVRVLTDVLGRPPAGFRAPYFSLTANTLWATDVLARKGFTYSSSVLPAINPQVGFPEAPRQPFRWGSGVIEMPAPTFGLGRLRLPLIGGAYLRLAPWFLVAGARSKASKRAGAWTYCHPYDFDDEEPFTRREGDGLLFSKLLFARRNIMLKRTMKIVSPGSTTLEQVVSEPTFLKALPTWSPPLESQ